MKTLAIANQKGGVGKSTLTMHLAHAAFDAGLRVLLVDMDAQKSLSMLFGANGNATGLKASGLYTPEVKGEPEIIKERLSIIRADSNLLAIDRAQNEILRAPAQVLRRFSEDFDLCLIDTPPLLGVRLMAALTASDFVVTPVSVGLLEMAGFADLVQTIHVVRTQGYNPRLKHIGILPAKINVRSKKEAHYLNELRRIYGDEMVLSETLYIRASVPEAVSNLHPVWFRTEGSSHLKAAREWKAACNTILERIKK